MHLFLTILYAVIFSVLIYRLKFFYIKNVPRKYLIGIFGLKIIFGLILGVVYMYHYEDRKSGDALRFFDDASIIYSSIEEDPVIYFELLRGVNVHDGPARKYYYEMTHWERAYSYGIINDNATIIRANAIVMLFSFGHYHVHTVFWCFFSFIGLFALFKTCCRFFPDKKTLLFIAVFLLPSVLFWGSGVLKEGLLLLGFGLLFHTFFQIYYRDGNFKTWLVLFASFLLLIYVKGYLLLAILPAILSLTFVRVFGKKHYLLKILAVHFAFVLFILLLPFVYPSGDVVEMMNYKLTDFRNIAELSSSGSYIETPDITSAFSILINSPQALTISYFRPFIWEIKNFLYIGPAIENVFLVICLLLMLWNFKLYRGHGSSILIFSLSSIIILGILLGSVVPILGALVRYKMPVLPLLFMLIFINTDWLRLQKRLPFIKKIPHFEKN